MADARKLIARRIEQPFAKSSLPLLIGMALSFAGVASLGAVAGGWAVEANTSGGGSPCR